VPQAIPLATRRMVSRFGPAATVAGLLTPIIAGAAVDAGLIAECNRLRIVLAAAEVSYVATPVDGFVS
jgi:hypothetical protein